MAFLELHDLSKKFPGCAAVDHINLKVDRGDFVVLLGPSGCGKTTTLRMISGLEVQSDGKIFLDGTDISDTPAERRDMAMVFQNLALYPHMSVFENIAFYLRNVKTPKPEIETRVGQAAAQVQITDLLSRYPDQLSGGQRQRVALARALVRSPKVFLLDEPLAALDAKLRASMRSEFKLLHKRLADSTHGSVGTFIYVTHDQVEALTLGSRIVVMNKGQIMQIATPHDLYNRPNHLFTATFVGSPEMNVIQGTLDRTPAAVRFGFGGVSVPSGERGRRVLGTAHQECLPVTLGIRPEAIRIVAQDTPDSISARILSLEPLGQTNQVVCQVGELLLTCLVPPELGVQEDSLAGVSFLPDQMHFFDPHSGKSLLWADA